MAEVLTPSAPYFRAKTTCSLGVSRSRYPKGPAGWVTVQVRLVNVRIVVESGSYAQRFRFFVSFVHESLGDLDVRIRKPGRHRCFKLVLTKSVCRFLPNDMAEEWRSWCGSYIFCCSSPFWRTCTCKELTWAPCKVSRWPFDFPSSSSSFLRIRASGWCQRHEEFRI